MTGPTPASPPALVPAPLRDEGGQATIEAIGWLPVLMLVAMAVACFLAAGMARELAGHAAEAGAIAIVQGGDPRDAARAAVPGWSRDRVTVRRSGRRVRVTLVPPLPLPTLARALTATATADAGPAPGRSRPLPPDPTTAAPVTATRARP